ncbi:protein WEAK CHLOROPLAST MOVEMENT UNDER BLUE LIGHT 1-like [Ananas comosus]|uniref:Protein WEAK CHLOROPLAST MOVEMENT UNDER BLUE LIGHT 1-like n=1 Tax=Ananas comosus TaxID=4615 RepID=A0A6P5FYT5_ANACO|nr:protein WEAK CHLOROPLAST MOVEMENT UNDER BLUE LIGHT 1-like [Ananas comosus]XP_020101549.1 protein WEAK CHLOROPLAST MOVEMENT UNDER BLUE LIGHT 1-like [Ananas comosus]XP_020101559.1 protein WEAK CHLOROPLAST MOVEMENT UNDER BLUE LIGHT 1-like [Ananas comosus]XP_020101568.1 protein WEAK CHLOROPLAST MOVEMENT UNDER BLUE LIGHT 1-like [Ananas comosus]
MDETKCDEEQLPESQATSAETPIPPTNNEDTNIEPDIRDSLTQANEKSTLSESSNESKDPIDDDDDSVALSSQVLVDSTPRALDKLTKPDSSNDLKTPVDVRTNDGPIDSTNKGKAVLVLNDVQSGSEARPSFAMRVKEYRPGSQVKSENLRKEAWESSNSRDRGRSVNPHRGVIDTAAPFESVKAAVSKFGGIVDWKAHKSLTLERSGDVQLELEKVQKEIPAHKMQLQATEEAKAQVLKELESTRRLVEEVKLDLEKVQTEEAQAKQDSELAQLRMKEIEQGIAGEASVVAKAQLDVGRARRDSAFAELKSVKEELQALQEQYGALLCEKDAMIRKADESISESKGIEKKVEELTVELISAKEKLESAHAAHLDAEDRRIGASLAREQDCIAWEKELKQAEEEIKRLNEQRSSAEDLKSKLNSASDLLLNLKAELAACTEAKLNGEDDNITGETNKMRKSIQEALDSKRKEIEEVEGSIEKAKEEVSGLKLAVSTLRSELDKEKAVLATVKQREGMASIAVSSLEAELNKTREEIETVEAKEKETRENMMELPKLLPEAAQEANRAKSAAKLAQEELRKADEEAEQAKASVITTEIRMHAALKEIEAARTSEKLALAAIKALQDSEEATSLGEDSPKGETLSIDEYFTLSKRAHEAEVAAREKAMAATAQVESAKESEFKSLEILNQVYKEIEQKREALRVASEKAEKAQKEKLAAEQELRNWREESEQRRKIGDTARSATFPKRSYSAKIKSFDEREHEISAEATVDPKSYTPQSSPEQNVSDAKLRRKRSFFPRVVMSVMTRRKAQTDK